VVERVALGRIVNRQARDVRGRAAEGDGPELQEEPGELAKRGPGDGRWGGRCVGDGRRALAGIDGADGRVAAVRLEDGERIAADVVLVATGAQPNVEWLEGSGLEVRSGVVCDERCQAVGARDVFAAGDVAEFPHPLADGEHVRIEHWSNAGEQGTAAGLNLLRAPDDRVPYTPMPSFWSDQYDVKVQSVGFPHRADTVTVVEGAVADRKFVAACARDGIVVGAIGFSVPRKMLAMRKVVAARTPLADVLAQASSSA